ncbi:cytochrome P450 750A1-like [Cryptomeria japonica]|uniref:cytochrome P450 750A1-like n=1 Tax=Cryptomeria japonica TaxID=3369 RepID=UPI0027DA20A2|nr:cytochrome P450 750A1-like [Cryptomeria japonica]
MKDGPYAPATAAACALIVFLWVLHRFSVQRKNTLGFRLPPGPFAWPIIGNLNQLKRLPHRDLHELGKKYGPIMMLKLGSVRTVVVSSSPMAKEFLKTQDNVFASRPRTAAGKYIAYNFKDLIFAPYGAYWRHMRKLCVVELLNTKRIQSFSCVREEEILLATRSVWEMSGQGRKLVNLTNMISSFVQAVMWRILSGRTISFHCDTNSEEIKKMGKEVSATVGAVNIGDFIPYLDWLDLQGVNRRMKKVHNSFDQVIRKIIEEHQQRRREFHKESATKDIIDVLLEIGKLNGREITEENIKAIVFDIFIGGIETTSTSIDWAMSAILKNPGVAKKMQEEIDSVVGRERTVSERDVASMEYVQCVVKETLRLYPAAPLLLPHESIQDCTIGGFFIPERNRLIVNAWAIGRDPSLWEDPLAFKPERFMGKNVDIVRDRDYFDILPFGAGRRGCPGAAMAVVTMNLLLAQFIHCFEWSVEGDLDMTEVFGSTTPRSVELLARPSLRLSTCP